MRYLNETFSSEKYVSFMTDLGYEATSHKLSHGKSLVLTLFQTTNIRLFQTERVCR